MKNSIRTIQYLCIVILSVLLAKSNARAQEWDLISPYPTSTHLQGIDFINKDTGFVVGVGEIYKTTDGGITWTEKPNDFNTVLHAVDFINDHVGYAVGGAGWLLRTEDCGENWERILSHMPERELWNIKFMNEQVGYIMGSDNFLLKTRDGGLSWQVASNISTGGKYWYNCDFVSEDTVFFVGAKGSMFGDGFLAKTTDGGETITELNIPEYMFHIYALEAISDQEIWLGDGRMSRIFHTLNGGDTWDTIALEPYARGITRMKFFNETTGKILCNGQMYHTEDGGATWTENSFHNGYLEEIAWIDEDTYVTSGYAGYIFKTENAGYDWTELSSGPRESLFDIAYLNSNEALVCGNRVLLKTEDLGASWTQIEVSPENNGLYYSIDFDTEGNGWIGSFGWLLHTIDGGDSWAKIWPDIDTGYHHFYDVKVIDSVIWAGADSARIFRSVDMGISWEDISIENEYMDVEQMDLIDEKTAYVSVRDLPYGELYKTSDGGNTWSIVEYGMENMFIRSLDFIDYNTGVMSVQDTGILRTVDGGENWTYHGKLNDESITHIQFFDDQKIIACNGDYIMGVSGDAGNNWELFYTNNLRNININQMNFIDVNHGILVGGSGLIKTFTGNYFTSVENTDVLPENPYIISPNPVFNMLKISPEPTNAQIQIHDQQGNFIKQLKTYDNFINVSELPVGVYLLNIINSKNEQYTRKFIKMR